MTLAPLQLLLGVPGDRQAVLLLLLNRHSVKLLLLVSLLRRRLRDRLRGHDH